MELNCEMTESVVFHPVDKIHTSITSWIVTTGIDFNPYKNALSNINKYALKVKQYLVEYSDSFQSSDLKYDHLLNITIKDLHSVLNEISTTQIDASNLIDHIQKPRTTRNK